MDSNRRGTLVVMVIVVGLVAAWAWRDAVRGTAPVVQQAPSPARTDAIQPRAAEPAKPTYPGGFVAVDPASLSPHEREALREREARASAAAPPVASFKGIDGKPRAFRYPDATQAAAAERTRQARREQLMRELAADPARFARDHQLSLDEVRWIVDGETDFPDRILEP